MDTKDSVNMKRELLYDTGVSVFFFFLQCYNQVKWNKT